MLNVISKFLKFSEFNLFIYSFIISTGLLFFLYFMFYLFLTGNSLFLIIALVEGIIGIISIFLLLKITENE